MITENTDEKTKVCQEDIDRVLELLVDTSEEELMEFNIIRAARNVHRAVRDLSYEGTSQKTSREQSKNALNYLKNLEREIREFTVNNRTFIPRNENNE